MALAPMTNEQRQIVKEALQLDDDLMINKTKLIKEWFNNQPHLPRVPDLFIDKMIYTYLAGTKMSTEKTKYKLDSYYAMRHQLPEIFLQRDPMKESVRRSVEVMPCIVLSELTPDAVRTTIITFGSETSEKLTATHLKAFYQRLMLINDIRIMQGDFCRGEYLVFDCKLLYASYVTEVPWTLVQKFTALIQEGLPVRVKKVFLINAPGVMETVVNLIKPALKDKIRKRIEVFSGDHTKLYQYIPKKILPRDYGGAAPSIEESNEAWQNTMESMRDFLREDEKRLTDESKRPRDSKISCGQMFGVDGTFIKLNID